MKKIARGYTLNECPPVGEAIPLSIQQIVVLIFNVLPVPLLIGGGIGLNAAEITILVAGCLLVTGIATILQTIGAGPIGAKLPIPPLAVSRLRLGSMPTSRKLRRGA